MRAVPALMQSIIDEGVFVGDARNSARATVEVDWFLNLATGAEVGNWPIKKQPLRWFQKAANDQVETEIPNVMVIDIDESIDNAADACTISIVNQKMRSNVGNALDVPIELGQPGFYTFSRGQSPEAQARWSQTTNEWEDVLVPDALIRTYEGWGGHGKSIAQAVADGNLMLTGTWLVDDVIITTGGKLELKCRDMMKLLIEQQLWPPLIPYASYPLSYSRWLIDNVALNAHGVDVGTVTNIAPGDRTTRLSGSSVDAWYPKDATGSEIPNGGFVLNGHRAADAFDGDTETYWLGEGNSRADAEFATSWLEVDCGAEAANAVYVHPWAGGYTMYVSVMENGQWLGDDVVPYDPSVLFGTQPYAVDTGAAIPYVMQTGIPWETPGEYALPRVYAADKVRISFRNLVDSGLGPWHFRAGVREFRVRIGSGSDGAQVGSVAHIEPTFYAAASIMDITNPATTGYLTASQLRQIDAFGDARTFDKTGGDDMAGVITGLEFTKTRKGYYAIQADGRITCYGDAVFYGSPYRSGVSAGAQNLFSEVLMTHTGLGYWVLRWDGTIRSYGDAPTYANVAVPGGEHISRGCANPQANGLFLICSNGTVFVRGTATAHGNFTGVALSADPALEGASDIAATSTGNGYWILTSAGRVQAKGDAVYYGQATTITPTLDNHHRFYELMPAPDNRGYLIMQGDGEIFPIGTVEFFGGPAGGMAELRKDGNYLDYSDIIKDLVLWSGWFLKEDLTGTQAPSVFGGIETTGAYSNDALPADMFDKHPVIDVINQLKEIVGYLVYARYDGGFIFKSPNWWQAGNFDEDGNHVDTIPEVDERIDLTAYSVKISDTPVRSEILIASQKIDPLDGHARYVRYIPKVASLLRGMVRPAMWVDGSFVDEHEELLMAELISLHIWFQVRTSQVTANMNPAIQRDDQIRILERETSESWVHYVRGRHTVNDMQAGTYTATYTTNWLGDREHWVITTNDVGDGGSVLSSFQISPELGERIRAAGASPLFADGTTNLTQHAIPDSTDHGNKAGPA